MLCHCFPADVHVHIMAQASCAQPVLQHDQSRPIDLIASLSRAELLQRTDVAEERAAAAASEADAAYEHAAAAEADAASARQELQVLRARPGSLWAAWRRRTLTCVSALGRRGRCTLQLCPPLAPHPWPASVSSTSSEHELR